MTKFSIELPVGLGEQIWFLLGTDIRYGVLCGFHYIDGGEVMLQIFISDEQPILNLPKSQGFPTRKSLVDFMLEKLLNSEVSIDIK